MRSIWICIVAGASSAVVAISFAAPLQVPRQEDSKRPLLDARQIHEAGRMTADEAETIVGLFFPQLPPQSPESDKAIAGLPPGSRPELLTWERVYTLALVRARIGPARSAEVLQAKGFAEMAARHGIADFGRFRNEFLAQRPAKEGAFRDPSGDYLDLLRRLQVIDNARRNVAQQENVLTLYQELIRGEASGVSALDVDLVETSVIGARERLAGETSRFRDGLDEFKVALGLAPRAPAIPDREGIAAFREAFDSVHNWHRDPKRTLDVLNQLIARLPSLGEVMIEGQPILGAIEANPGRLEDVLSTAARVAGKKRGSGATGETPRDADVQLELRIGRRIRRLADERHAYDSEKRHYHVTHRLIEELLTGLIAPPAGGTHALAQSARVAVGTATLLNQLGQIQRTEDRLVGLWTSFKSERLALYRDLGALPNDDWKSFYDDLAARLAAIR